MAREFSDTSDFSTEAYVSVIKMMQPIASFPSFGAESFAGKLSSLARAIARGEKPRIAPRRRARKGKKAR